MIGVATPGGGVAVHAIGEGIDLLSLLAVHRIRK
jgi:hypothetical protein